MGLTSSTPSSVSLQRLRPDSRFFETVFEHSTLISIFRVLSLTSVGLRELHNITCLVYDKTNKEQRDKMRACLTECIDEAAKMGWGEYRTHPAFYDQVSKTKKLSFFVSCQGLLETDHFALFTLSLPFRLLEPILSITTLCQISTILSKTLLIQTEFFLLESMEFGQSAIVAKVYDSKFSALCVVVFSSSFKPNFLVRHYLYIMR